jgi:hypothetical protein
MHCREKLLQCKATSNVFNDSKPVGIFTCEFVEIFVANRIDWCMQDPELAELPILKSDQRRTNNSKNLECKRKLNQWTACKKHTA